LREQVKVLITEALTRAVSEGALIIDALPEVVVDRSRDPAHGDFASPVALGLARAARKSPRDIAGVIVGYLDASEFIERTEIAGPGFINVFLAPPAYHGLLNTVRAEGADFGRSTMGAGQSVQVEFVSANPTGPLHVGHGRGAAYGSAIADILEAAGFDVQREYYVNDAGRQMDILATSVWLRYLELCGEIVPFPSNGYKGDYIFDIAATVHREDGDQHRTAILAVMDGIPADELPQEDKAEGAEANGDKEAHIDALIARARELVGAQAYRRIFDLTLDTIRDDIERDLSAFGVDFQRWFSERTLVESNAVGDAVKRLQAAGHIYEEGGALWFKSTDFGDEKDRVVIRENGVGTYFASDIAYHLNKFARGFTRVINVWGADHHGYIARVKGALTAAGEDADRLEVQLVQFANLFKGGEKMQMSTRSGEFVTLRELREDVGRDAARFFYTMRKNDQHLDFDLDLAKSRSRDNPVYYVQYAHARVCSVFRRATESDMDHPPASGVELDRLVEAQERDLMLTIARYPEVVESAAADAAPHQVAHYLRDLATALHQWYDTHKALVEDRSLRHARMALADAARIVLANGLNLLGVSAPEKM
jgi:arginyl-tRNA synthetase